MGRRKWKIYQDVVLARNLPMQASPEDGDQQALDHNSDDEESSMLAAAELDQAGSPHAAGPLAQDKPSAAGDSPSPTAPSQAEADPASDTPTSKDTSVTQTNSDDNNGEALQPPKEQKQQILKIKTIEEINTVKKDGAEEKTTTILESLIKRSSAGPPRRTQPLVQMQPQQPVDWQPQDKCNFCVDGELVRPAAVTQDVVPEQPPSPVESESGSSSSRSAVSPPRPQFQLPAPQAQALAHLLQLQQARSNPALNQMQAMTLAAMAALGGAGNACGYPPMLLQHWMGQQQRAAVTPERVSAESEKNSAASPSAVAASAGPNSEQPLDLSAKSAPTPGAASCSPSPPGLEQRLAPLRVPINDKNLFNRSKPRLPGAAGGRRAYSDAELQMALRDIQSGRLGTRRAAVLYNIPRSTLRNKVYKMAVEREREASVPGQIPTERDDSNDIADDVDDDKDSIMDEDKYDDRENPQTMLSMNDILRISQMDNAGYGADSIRAMLQKNEQKFFDMKSPTRDSQSDLWPGIAPNVMRPYLQSLLINSLGAASIPKTEENNTSPMMPEIARLLAEEKNNILKGQLMKREHMNNGKQPDFSEDELNKNLYSRQSSSASSVITRNDRVTPGIKPDSPDDMAMDVTEHNESGESPSNVILKIPSFQPSAQGSKNGGETFPGSITPPLPYFSHSPLPGGQLGSRTGDRFSPSLGLNQGILSLKDVIAKSISDKFQQQVPTHQNHNNDMHQMGSSRSPGMDAMEGLSAFKRERLSSSMGAQGGISVIKNMSHDLTRSFSNNNSANQNQQNNAAGGKGTRPKRGKYRNYDRDSLVEAVKAVQRGEMSVHRAGSYYGVPHSTLEYKVKERHLMRPRKREPKPPLPDEKMTPGASKPSDLTPGSSVRNDKAKPIQKPPMKPNFPAGSPNGLKMPPIFDGGLALGYNPSSFPFWPHPPPFHRLSVDFNPRNPTPGATGFPSNPESFFASQMMQRLQEESARQPGGSESANSIMNSAREMAEQYENAVGGANGSFLEGIIRNRLEQPTGPPGQEEGDTVRRRLRPDDLLLAEEMREAARRLRARDGVTASPTIAPHLPPHPS